MMDLRSEVIYALQQPLIRLQDVVFNRDKKMVKRVLKNQARVMGAGTHYVLDNDLLDVIIPSLKRASIRQFVNAYWNARPPHKSFFVEWDHSYLLKHFDLNPVGDTRRRKIYGPDYLEKPLFAGVSSTYSAPTKITHLPTSLPKNALDIKETLIPQHQAIRFFGQSATTDSKKPPIHMSSGELLQFDLQDIEDHYEKFGLVPEVFRGGPALFREWFDLEDLEKYDGLYELSVSCLPSRHRVCSIREPMTDGTYGTAVQHFQGYEFLHFQVFIAAISLLNFDWVTTETKGITDRGTRSVNTQAIAQDLYKTIKVNLPKDKAIAEFHKHKVRTRKFGTAQHTVRGHWRLYKKTGERVWIGEHSRGDEKYGTVHKDYVLTKRENYLKTEKRV
jgi:hypothetical protein